MDIQNIGKFISLILRHKPETIGLHIDEYGWANTEELIKGIKLTYKNFDMSVLEAIVQTDNKQRYSFSEDKKFIRANQGHSIPVNVELEELTDVPILYHGTSSRFTTDIDRDGLKPMSRLYVHLSGDLDTARNVGKRHGAVLVIYEIDTKSMVKDGYKFYKSTNGVYLTKIVPSKYLHKV